MEYSVKYGLYLCSASFILILLIKIWENHKALEATLLAERVHLH